MHFLPRFRLGASPATACEKTFRHAETTRSSEYDWSFTAPPNVTILRKVTFTARYDATLYESNDGEKRWVRRLAGRPMPGADDFQAIPHRVNGVVEPLSYDRIVKDYYNHMSNTDKARMASMRDAWVAKGYVYRGQKPPASKPIVDPPKAKLPGPNTLRPTTPSKTPPGRTTPGGTTPGKTSPGKANTAPKGPDLTAVFEAAKVDGDRLTVRLTVKNIGDKPTAACEVKAFASKNLTVEPKKDIRLGFKNIPMLMPGQDLRISISEKVDAERLFGMKVLVLLDNNNAVKESNEKNNLIVSNKTIGKGKKAKKGKKNKKGG